MPPEGASTPSLLKLADRAGQEAKQIFVAHWVHRNKGTWRDMRSASIVFARSLLLIGDSAGGCPSTFALNGPACARINMLDRFDLSDEKLRDALDSPLKSLREAAPIPRAAEREKAGHIKSMPVRGCIPILLVKRRCDAASNRGSRPDGCFQCSIRRRSERWPRFRPAAPLPPYPRKMGRTPSRAAAAHPFVGFIERAQAGPLSAKVDGKPPALSSVSNRLRAKTIEADLMSRHVPLL